MGPVCVRCGAALRRDGRCEDHGAVAPLRTHAPLTDDAFGAAVAAAGVPVWQLSPPPVGWTVGGMAVAGDDPVGIALAWSGPSPLGDDDADLIVVAEEPGVGLGARYAGLPGLDAGDCVVGAPDEHVEVRGHPVALWCCTQAPADRTVLVGEADGNWLWLVLWPADAEALLLEHLLLADARERLVPQQRGEPSRHLFTP
jgi:hypothetical protein